MNEAQHAEACAADWIARRDAHGWSTQQERELEAWLGASTLNRVSYLRLNAVWRLVDELAMPPTAQAPPAVRALPRFSRWRMAAAVTLVAMSAAVVGALVGMPVGMLGRGEHHRTALGVQRTVALVDGSQVELNTDTRLRTRIEPAQRQAWLDQGEAFFAVAHDSRAPFVVIAGDHRIEVLGTRFSVRREGDTVSVVVLEGRVRFKSRASPEHSILTASAAITAGAADAKVDRKSLAQMDQALSWRQGQLVLDDMTLGAAAAEFNRYNSRKLVVQDAWAAGIVIGGRFDIKNVEAFARLLQHGFGLERREHADHIDISTPTSGF